MKSAGMAMLLACAIALPLVQSSLAQEKTDEGPKNEKAQKTYKEALEDLHHHYKESALEKFEKADKQDDGHCLACQEKMIKYGVELQDWKTAENAAEEMTAEAKGDRETAIAHYNFGMVLTDEGLIKHKDELFSRAHDEMTKALAAVPKFPQAIFADGRALAHLKQDQAAKARFEEFVRMRPETDPDRRRAQRYIEDPELARARMAPAFAVTTTDGQQIAMDDLVGKVVLLDFWATWCAPCREALPHMREIAKRFQGQPLVVLSISLDSDEQKWKDFIAKNEMTWPQYRDGGFTGAIAKKFGVTAIPHTFTIDADGVLQDEHIGDAAIEGKLKKLISRAHEVQAAAQ
jgi:peroxiredoxin/outer membrane protein assembly factor BamD (BamD/ComL family)